MWQYSASISMLALWYQVGDMMPSFPKIKPEAQEIKSAAHFFLFFFFSPFLPGLKWKDSQEQGLEGALTAS